MGEDIAQVAEDFRLYCLSYWSDVYLFYVEWFNAAAASEVAARTW